MAFKRIVTLRASFRFPAIRFDAPTLLSFSGFTHAHAKCPPVKRDLFPIEWRQQIEAFWLAINVHNSMQGLIVFINNWAKQFQFGVVKIKVRVNGLPDWEIHESRQTSQLFSTKYWGGFHAELFQIKVDSTSGIMHSMVISEKSGRRSFHLRREFLKVHTGDTSKYW